MEQAAAQRDIAQLVEQRNILAEKKVNISHEIAEYKLMIEKENQSIQLSCFSPLLIFSPE